MNYKILLSISILSLYFLVLNGQESISVKKSNFLSIAYMASYKPWDSKYLRINESRGLFLYGLLAEYYTGKIGLELEINHSYDKFEYKELIVTIKRRENVSQLFLGPKFYLLSDLDYNLYLKPSLGFIYQNFTSETKDMFSANNINLKNLGPIAGFQIGIKGDSSKNIFLQLNVGIDATLTRISSSSDDPKTIFIVPDINASVGYRFR